MAAKKTAEFTIVNRRTGKALTAVGADNGQNVVQAALTNEDTQVWMQAGSRGPVKFINKASGKALDVVDGGVENGTWAHVWDDLEDAPSQKWEVVRLTATYKKLKNVQSGKMLDIVDMSEEDGALAQLWDDVEGEGQQWKFVPVQSEEPAPAPAKEEPVKKAPAKKAAAKKPAARKKAK